MAIKIETPPTFNGEPENRLKQVIAYLFRLSENLNVALNNLTYADIGGAATDANATGGSSSGGAGRGDAYEELRELIINTAGLVRAEEQRLEQEFTSRYEAISTDWGTFQENISNSIETTARGVVNSYGYDSLIATLQEEAAGFSEYQIHTEGFIRQGFIDTDSEGVPILGIAIGQNLTSTEVTIGGEKYQQFDDAQSCAFYTADRVSFRINGQEVAYISNRKLYIGDAEINNSMTFGGKWLVTHGTGFTIRWIGG